MFINLSNHPSDKWSKEQLEAASIYGDVVDIPFPQVEPEASEEEIMTLADEYADRINEIHTDQPFVHVMGEMTFTYAMVRRLQSSNITCLASTTRREVKELEDGKRITTFRFVKFRRYV